MADPRFFHHSGPFALEDIAEKVGATVARSTNAPHIANVSAVQTAEADDITFLTNHKYMDYLKDSAAGACIIEPKHKARVPERMALLLSDNPYATYAKVAQLFYPVQPIEAMIAPSAAVDDSATIGSGCRINPNAVIEKNVTIGSHSVIGSGAVIAEGVTIGEGSIIGAQSTITHTIIGDRTILHPGVHIGQDGFGFAFDKGVHLKVPQLGRVIIGNDVEIGAGTCIDRGAGPDTIIGDGCKIDNLVQIGHNVTLGRGCIIVAMVGIAGSTTIEDYAVIGGQAGIAGHLTVGAGAQIAAGSGITKDVPPGAKWGGYPAVPIRQWHTQTIKLKQLVKKEDR